jgi:diguanylate cyclase (GGDEF)-like protein
MLPTLTIALFSYQSVRSQLAEQAEERLQALAQFAGRTIYDRLTMLESDLGNSAARAGACITLGNRDQRAGETCADTLGYALSSLAVIEGTTVSLLLGTPPSDRLRAIVAKLALGPKGSVLTTVGSPGAPTDLVLVHRLDDAGSSPRHLVGVVDRKFLWTDSDAESLPEPVSLAIWDPEHGDLLDQSTASIRVGDDVVEQMTRSATGTFGWSGGAGAQRAAYWTFPTGHRFGLPRLHVIVSEAEASVLAPMADFRRTFPSLLLVAVLAVLGFGLNQIRKRVIPLEALHQGTRRIAQHDFAARVEIESGDEIEELASSFNTMVGEVSKQFNELQAAAEADRAVLSLMDRAKIIETALTRLQDLVTTGGSTLALLDAPDESTATVWSRDAQGVITRSGHRLDLAPAEVELIRTLNDRRALAASDPDCPGFLAWLSPGRVGLIELYPVRFGDEILGLVALRRADADPATRASLIHVRHFANQVAVALGNARMVEQVRFLAFYDNLTELPNRMLYKERLGQALLRAERRRCHVAVCFLDLDQFSSINDSLGHDVGDRLIQGVASRLLTICRESDTIARLSSESGRMEVARLGGDEFTVVLPDLADPQDASRVARRLLNCFREPFRLGTHEVFVSTSIGIAIYPEDGRDIDDLLKNADVAMYHAKEDGRNNYRMYSPSMNAEAVARMKMEQQLRRAVEGAEFGLVYQPIIDLKTGEVTGAEALVRWNHPDRGVVSPAEFIALSEESGLIVRLGEWILRKVAEQARAWRVAGRPPLTMSVNLSARQLQDPDIVSTVRDILAETEVQPATLLMELTESVLMQPEGPVANSIRALADLGVRFAVDDFGTGYSSLSYLKHFPVATLKIDRAFVQHVPGDRDYSAITSAVVALARALDLEVVAEGVETEAQARFLLELGCHRAQGYLIGLPVSPEEFTAFVDRRVGARAGGSAKELAIVPAHSQ